MNISPETQNENLAEHVTALAEVPSETRSEDISKLAETFLEIAIDDPGSKNATNLIKLFENAGKIEEQKAIASSAGDNSLIWLESGIIELGCKVLEHMSNPNLSIDDSTKRRICEAIVSGFSAQQLDRVITVDNYQLFLELVPTLEQKYISSGVPLTEVQQKIKDSLIVSTSNRLERVPISSNNPESLKSVHMLVAVREACIPDKEEHQFGKQNSQLYVSEMHSYKDVVHIKRAVSDYEALRAQEEQLDKKEAELSKQRVPFLEGRERKELRSQRTDLLIRKNVAKTSINQGIERIISSEVDTRIKSSFQKVEQLLKARQLTIAEKKGDDPELIKIFDIVRTSINKIKSKREQCEALEFVARQLGKNDLAKSIDDFNKEVLRIGIPEYPISQLDMIARINNMESDSTTNSIQDLITQGYWSKDSNNKIAEVLDHHISKNGQQLIADIITELQPVVTYASVEAFQAGGQTVARLKGDSSIKRTNEFGFQMNLSTPNYNPPDILSIEKQIGHDFSAGEIMDAVGKFGCEIILHKGTNLTTLVFNGGFLVEQTPRITGSVLSIAVPNEKAETLYKVLDFYESREPNKVAKEAMLYFLLTNIAQAQIIPPMDQDDLYSGKNNPQTPNRVGSSFPRLDRITIRNLTNNATQTSMPTIQLPITPSNPAEGVSSKTPEQMRTEFSEKVTQIHNLLEDRELNPENQTHLAQYFKSAFGIYGIDVSNPHSNKNIKVERQEDESVVVTTPEYFEQEDGRTNGQFPKIEVLINTNEGELQKFTINNLETATFSPEGKLQSFQSSGIPEITIDLGNETKLVLNSSIMAGLKTSLDSDSKIEQIISQSSMDGFQVEIERNGENLVEQARRLSTKSMEFKEDKIIIALNEEGITRIEGKRVDGGTIEYDLKYGTFSYTHAQMDNVGGGIAPQGGEEPVTKEDIQRNFEELAALLPPFMKNDFDSGVLEAEPQELTESEIEEYFKVLSAFEDNDWQNLPEGYNAQAGKFLTKTKAAKEALDKLPAPKTDTQVSQEDKNNALKALEPFGIEEFTTPPQIKIYHNGDIEIVGEGMTTQTTINKPFDEESGTDTPLMHQFFATSRVKLTREGTISEIENKGLPMISISNNAGLNLSLGEIGDDTTFVTKLDSQGRILSIQPAKAEDKLDVAIKGGNGQSTQIEVQSYNLKIINEGERAIKLLMKSVRQTTNAAKEQLENFSVPILVKSNTTYEDLLKEFDQESKNEEKSVKSLDQKLQEFIDTHQIWETFHLILESGQELNDTQKESLRAHFVEEPHLTTVADFESLERYIQYLGRNPNLETTSTANAILENISTTKVDLNYGIILALAKITDIQKDKIVELCEVGFESPNSTSFAKEQYRHAYLLADRGKFEERFGQELAIWQAKMLQIATKLSSDGSRKGALDEIKTAGLLKPSFMEFYRDDDTAVTALRQTAAGVNTYIAKRIEKNEIPQKLDQIVQSLEILSLFGENGYTNDEIKSNVEKIVDILLRSDNIEPIVRILNIENIETILPSESHPGLINKLVNNQGSNQDLPIKALSKLGWYPKTQVEVDSITNILESNTSIENYEIIARIIGNLRKDTEAEKEGSSETNGGEEPTTIQESEQIEGKGAENPLAGFGDNQAEGLDRNIFTFLGEDDEAYFNKFNFGNGNTVNPTDLYIEPTITVENRKVYKVTRVSKAEDTNGTSTYILATADGREYSINANLKRVAPNYNLYLRLENAQVDEKTSPEEESSNQLVTTAQDEQNESEVSTLIDLELTRETLMARGFKQAGVQDFNGIWVPAHDLQVALGNASPAKPVQLLSKKINQAGYEVINITGAEVKVESDKVTGREMPKVVIRQAFKLDGTEEYDHSNLEYWGHYLAMPTALYKVIKNPQVEVEKGSEATVPGQAENPNNNTEIEPKVPAEVNNLTEIPEVVANLTSADVDEILGAEDDNPQAISVDTLLDSFIQDLTASSEGVLKNTENLINLLSYEEGLRKILDLFLESKKFGERPSALEALLKVWSEVRYKIIASANVNTEFIPVIVEYALNNKYNQHELLSLIPQIEAAQEYFQSKFIDQTQPISERYVMLQEFINRVDPYDPSKKIDHIQKKVIEPLSVKQNWEEDLSKLLKQFPNQLVEINRALLIIAAANAGSQYFLEEIHKSIANESSYLSALRLDIIQNLDLIENKENIIGEVKSYLRNIKKDDTRDINQIYLMEVLSKITPLEEMKEFLTPDYISKLNKEDRQSLIEKFIVGENIGYELIGLMLAGAKPALTLEILNVIKNKSPLNFRDSLFIPLTKYLTKNISYQTLLGFQGDDEGYVDYLENGKLQEIRAVNPDLAYAIENTELKNAKKNLSNAESDQ